MKTWKIIFWIIAHVILAHIMRLYPVMATIHAYVVLTIGVVWAIRGNKLNMIYTAAYIAGAEVLWRMTGAHIFWEFGKYAVIFIFLINLLTRGWKKPILPLMYFIFLLPSTVLLPVLISNVDRVSFQDISFNLSGPFALLICVLTFSKMKILNTHWVKTLFFLACPIVSILAIARYMTFTAKDLYFSEASNLATSGGFGPNQVSAILGLGALCFYLILLVLRHKIMMRVIFVLFAILFATQSALTFSRGGVYMAALSAIFATFYLIRNQRNFMRFAFVFIVLFFIADRYVWPRLVDFTEGAIEKRFKQTSLTNREDIFMEDLRIFESHFFLGVGPGQAKKLRHEKAEGAAAHVEFSRLLSEHGIFGLFSLIAMFLMALRTLKSAKTNLNKANAVAGLIWGLFFMGINGMRLLAPSFMFGFAAVTIIEIVGNPISLMKSDLPDLPETVSQ